MSDHVSLLGQCLCEAVQYRIRGALGPLGHCHCRTYRKSHAAAFATTTRVAWRNFEWTRGEASLRSFESTPGKKRFFCSTCGSPMLAAWDGDPKLILRLGSLVSDPESRPVVHVWTSEKVSWLELGDALPALPQGIPKG